MQEHELQVHAPFPPVTSLSLTLCSSDPPPACNSPSPLSPTYFFTDMSYERSTPVEFSIASSGSLWQSHRLSQNLPIVLSAMFSAIIAVTAILLKFTDIFPVTYRVVDCKDILPYQETGADVSWIDIDDEYFAISVIGLSILLVSFGHATS